MPEPTTATRPGARPPDFAAIALRGYFISQPTYKRNHKQTGTILRVDSREILLSTCTLLRNPHQRAEHTKGTMSQWFTQSPREEAASPLVRSAELAAGLAGRIGREHYSSACAP